MNSKTKNKASKKFLGALLFYQVEYTELNIT